MKVPFEDFIISDIGNRNRSRFRIACPNGTVSIDEQRVMSIGRRRSRLGRGCLSQRILHGKSRCRSEKSGTF